MPDTETASDERRMTGPSAVDLMRAVILEWRAGSTTSDDAMREVGAVLGNLSGRPSPKANPSDFA